MRMEDKTLALPVCRTCRHREHDGDRFYCERTEEQCEQYGLSTQESINIASIHDSGRTTCPHHEGAEENE